MDDRRIIVALDLRTAEEAVRLARALADVVAGFKVGLGLLHGAGPGLVGALARVGPVLADAKLHDIPSQVRVAARRLGEYGARWVTAHASGGVDMLRAATEGLVAGTGGSRAGILAVTVLTSIDAAAASALFGQSPGQLTSRLAKKAAEAGVEGLVCSPKELGVVADVAPGLLRVTPGIRPEGSPADDQRRTATPAEARARGADLLVVGRPITAAPDPVAAAQRLHAGLAGI
ncbi:MAG TPA: orotidine-5'-phosphate decarboxylase [Acidimicrobiia bacterium]|nr:orotidine-5'-phosphate decarboxylase [Acidimicrobiia bacterium]